MKLSCFILTKNNARSIRYAIESVYNYTDEVVIVDSGSTDETLDIAREYTDRIFFKELVDFSDQRNYAIKQCRGEWIFFLDADEVVGENFTKAFKYLNSNYRSLLMPRYNLISVKPMQFILTYPHHSEYQQRFFRNDGKCYFENPVHHQLMNSKPRLKLSFVHIFHFHFLICDYQERKKRNDYYKGLDEKANWPEYYLFEDYPYISANVLEMPESKILDILKQDGSFYTYKPNWTLKKQLNYNIKYSGYELLTKARGIFGI